MEGRRDRSRQGLAGPAGTPRVLPAILQVCNGGNDKSVRLHFIFDEDACQIVIGHFGKHLPNTLS